MDNSLLQEIDSLIRRGESRFCTPGHKGVLPAPLAEAALWDVTETETTDSLYEASGVLEALETKLSKHYQSETVISAGGSTLCIQAMLATAIPQGGKIAIVRGCHQTAINAMALLGIEPVWLYPEISEETGLPLPVSGEAVKTLLQKTEGIRGVYLTSPDYYGQLADIAVINKVCKIFRIPLLVDAAHGAHLAFIQASLHPITLGADFCCTSLHKTLPALTGAALLHFSDVTKKSRVKKAMSLFGSSSPSYLIMLSIDMLEKTMDKELPMQLEALVKQTAKLKQAARQAGLQTLVENVDPIRLSIGFYARGYTKEEFLKACRKVEIIPEYTDSNYCVMLPGVTQSGEDWQRIYQLFVELPPKQPRKSSFLQLPKPVSKIALRKAVLANGREVATQKAEGCIAAACVAPCPPGIPLLVPGEEISKEMIDCLLEFGISIVSVL